jgi:carbon-monoxide dehydrogenase large subunit
VDKLPWLGVSVRRKEDNRLLRGSARFLDDLEDAELLHVAIVRCPYPHARIRRVDVGAARALPGVEAILTSEIVAERTEPITVLRPFAGAARTPFYAMAFPVARYEGEPVVGVAARDRYVAEDAAERVEIDWDPLPHVVDVEAALADGAPRLHESAPGNLLVESTAREGTPDAELARSHLVVRGAVRINRVSPLPIETRGVIARYLADSGVLEIAASTQTPHLLRHQLAHALRMAESDIRVVAPDIGGAFGLKIGLYPEDVIVALLSIDTGRPVKWLEDRVEFFRSSIHAREARSELALGASADGRLTALDASYTVDVGAYNGPLGPPLLTNLMLPGPYRLRHGAIRRRVALTNKVPMGAYRGYGQAESNYVREVMIDRVARRLGEDPANFRRRNLLRPDELPWRNISGATYDSGDYARSLDLALSRIGYEELREQQSEWWRRGRHVGVGMSCYVEFTGYPSSAFLGRSGASFGAYESVTIRMDRAGRASLYTGVSTFGQSTETTFAQVAASLLGLDPDDITIHPGDSLATPYSVGGFASRTMIAGAGAIERAAIAIRDKMLRIAAPMLQAPADLLELTPGLVRRRDDPSSHVAIRAIAQAAILGHPLPAGEAPGLEATAYYDPPASAFGYGAAAARVEVEPRTGEFTLDRYVLVHDCGTQVNPMVVEGQVHGGIAQGLGAALYEEIVYDGETGQLVNGTMLDYFMPTAADLPPFELDHLETPSPVTTFGIKGVGEGGTIAPAAAVTNAICDALAPFGVELDRLPITAESVWRALEAARPRAPGRA